MLPLAIAAAYYFLELKARGVPVELAIALGGLSCALIYTVLAVLMRLPGYAVLAYVALPIGAAGAAELLGGRRLAVPAGWLLLGAADLALMAALPLGAWRPLLLVPLVPLLAVAGRQPERLGRLRRLGGGEMEPLAHLAALAALVAAAA